jgi:uncharacterized protein (DUF1778 family)
MLEDGHVCEVADGDLNQDAASIHQASATAFVMHAAR